NLNEIIVGTDHCVEPHAASCLQKDVAYQRGIGGDKMAFALQSRLFAANRIHHIYHSDSSETAHETSRSSSSCRSPLTWPSICSNATWKNSMSTTAVIPQM